jgi:hypothetical protein
MARQPFVRTGRHENWFDKRMFFCYGHLEFGAYSLPGVYLDRPSFERQSPQSDERRTSLKVQQVQ